MKKQNKVLLIILAVLVIVAVAFFANNSDLFQGLMGKKGLVQKVPKDSGDSSVYQDFIKQKQSCDKLKKDCFKELVSEHIANGNIKNIKLTTLQSCIIEKDPKASECAYSDNFQTCPASGLAAVHYVETNKTSPIEYSDSNGQKFNLWFKCSGKGGPDISYECEDNLKGAISYNDKLSPKYLFCDDKKALKILDLASIFKYDDAVAKAIKGNPLSLNYNPVCYYENSDGEKSGVPFYTQKGYVTSGPFYGSELYPDSCASLAPSKKAKQVCFTYFKYDQFGNNCQLPYEVKNL